MQLLRASLHLRALLKTSEVAECFDEVARMRIGRTISRAVFKEAKLAVRTHLAVWSVLK